MGPSGFSTPRLRWGGGGKGGPSLLIGQPQGSLSESRWFVVFICFNVKFSFSCGLPT